MRPIISSLSSSSHWTEETLSTVFQRSRSGETVATAGRLVATLMAMALVRFAFSADRPPEANANAESDPAHATLLAELKRTSFDQQTVRQLAGKKHFKAYAGNPVLSPGKRGAWDAGAIGSMTVVIVDGEFHMYYEAWGVVDPANSGVDYSSLQIGHALSFDGVHWMKDSANPVVPKGVGDEWDASGTWDPYVIHEDGVFKMWYGGGIDPRCDWGYAECRDGSQFVKRGQLSHLRHVEDDHVVHDTTRRRYFMYYWDRAHEPQGLFRAESADEMHFDFGNAVQLHIDDEQPDAMYKFTHVHQDAGTWYMLYANFVRPDCPNSTTRLAISNDGQRWKRASKHLFAGHDADVVRVGASLYLAYFGPQGYFDQKDSDVRLALFDGKLSDLLDNNSD